MKQYTWTGDDPVAESGYGGFRYVGKKDARIAELEAENAALWAFVRAVERWETQGGWKFVIAAREALRQYEGGDR